MVKNLKVLLTSLGDYEIFGQKDSLITGISDDSRRIKKGSLFVAIKGLNVDASKFIPDAISRGARAVVSEESPRKSWLDKGPYIKVPNSRRALGLLASFWYDCPSKKLKVIGVTGTDGKTTTVNLIHWILEKAGKKAGLVSTVGVKLGKKVYDTGLHVTNPEALALQGFLAKMVKKGCQYAVLEVTSHGLDQERVAGINFDTAVLTNITHEHIDYHKTWNSYRRAKAKLFKNARVAVLNKDDESFGYISRFIPKKAQVVSYSLEESGDYRAESMKTDKFGTKFNLVTKNRSFPIKTRLLGKYNILNILAAAATSRELGISWKDMSKALAIFKSPAGRLEKIPNDKGFDIYIDFAHTPNSLERTFGFLRETTKGRLIAVFGCAGERDVEKRHLMGEISGRLSDISVFTAEDPRSDDVAKIIGQMVKGAKKAGAREFKADNYHATPVLQKSMGQAVSGSRDIKGEHRRRFVRIPERGEAVYFAIQKLARKGDVVVICGKGHEKSMGYNGIEHPWSDKKAVKRALGLKKALCAIVLAAGKGARMKSPLPKVLHKIAGRPIITYTLENLRAAHFEEIVVVVGYKKNKVRKEIIGLSRFAYQKPPLGTGDAAAKGLRLLRGTGKDVLVINGDDSAFYSSGTITGLVNKHREEKAKITFGVVLKESPGKMGIIRKDSKGNILGIHHWKGEGKPPKKGEICCGIYMFDRNWLRENVKKIPKNESGEYYITDLIGMSVKQKVKIQTIEIPKEEWLGVNTKEELLKADSKKREILRKYFNGF